MSKKKISIVFGGPSSEYEVSLSSTKSILKYINWDKYNPYLFYISKKGKAKLYKAKDTLVIPKISELKDLFTEVKKLKGMDMNLIALHGEFGEDGIFQSILQFLDIPFTGCRSDSSALCMDKYRSGLLVEKEIDVKIPKTEIYRLGEIINNYKYSKKICIKPNTLGSSVGVYLVQSKQDFDNAIRQLKKDYSLHTYFIIQDLIDENIELSCGCLQKKDGEYIKLPPIEIIPQSSKFFDYTAKYTKGASIEITPPKNVSKEISDKISQIAVGIHSLLGCTLYSRSDFLIKDGDIYYLETNTLPGLTSTSLLPQ